MKTPLEFIDAYRESNDPPSDVDCLHISQLVEEERNAVISLDDEISHLRARIAELSLVRIKRTNTIEKLRAIISPLRHLPPEILSIVFMHCLRAGDEDNIIRNPDILTAPLLLVRICSRWRKIALATPRLWTEMQLHLPNWLGKEPWQIILLNNWVVNASPLPISLAAKCHSFEVLTRALWVTNRFKALHLRLSAQSIRVLRGCTPRTRHIDAERLQIHITNHWADATFRQNDLYSAFKNSASLRSFTLISDTPSRPALFQFSLPWAQLTHLYIDEPLVFTATAVLVQCINLIECTFGTLGGFEDDEDAAIQQQFTFSCLTDASFTFDAFGLATADNFFRPLICPTLKKLVLRDFDFPDGQPTMWASNAFSSFQMRSAFNLEILELHVLVTTAALSELIGSLPTLKSFALSTIHDAVALFALLTFDAPNGLLPRLERLKLSFVQSDMYISPFIAMIRSRRKRVRATASGTPVSRLQHLHIISTKPTLPIDRWWWQWKLGLVFPKLELEFECMAIL